MDGWMDGWLGSPLPWIGLELALALSNIRLRLRLRTREGTGIRPCCMQPCADTRTTSWLGFAVAFFQALGALANALASL